MDIKSIDQLLRSGSVRRWHANPDMSHHAESLAEHQWAVAMIATHLYPRISGFGLFLALTHDVGEIRTGDLPFEFKASCDKPTIMGVTEHEVRARHGIAGPDYANPREREVVKLADWMAAAYFVARKEPWLLETEEWQDQERRISDTMSVLGGDIERKGIDVMGAIKSELVRRGRKPYSNNCAIAEETTND